MSEFLARLAARAVGQAAAAQPRLPGLFETGSGSGAVQDGFEVIDEEVPAGRRPAAAVAATEASRAAVPAEPAPGGRPAPVAATPTDSLDVVVRTTTADAAGSGSTTSPRRARLAVARRDVTAERPAATDRGPSSAVGDGRDAEPIPPASLPVAAVPLAAVSPTPSWSGSESIRAATTPAQEPPTVRVHIGRLEIRASLPEAETARPPTRRVREELVKGVSLADYLRGAR